MAMILVDGMPRKHAKAVRTELMLALSASLIGRNLAKRSAFPNAEEVAIAALFKNMGRLILAAHDDQLYWETMSLAKEKGYSEARASSGKTWLHI
ncbi:MAG: HDOD domain-containing protein [Burkholderiales bacterium]|nr:HDOD domain-containing protein [Burkholderiales bacterium]